VKYPRLIAGTMTWGSWGKLYSKKDMISLMHHCLENTITTFNHADIYGGNAFTESGIKREDL